MLARSGHEVAPPAHAHSIMSLPATSSLHSCRQRRSDLQEDSNSESGTGSDDDQGTSSDSDDNNKKINSSPRLRLARCKTVGPTANDTPTVATAMTAAEETGPTVSLAATGNGTIMSTATSQTNTTSICNPTMSIVTAIAPLAPVDNVQIIHSTVGMATSDSHPGGTLSTLKGPAPDSVSTALDQSDAAPTTPPGPGAVPVQGTLFYFILWM